jgi:chemotaxis-related protein WspD
MKLPVVVASTQGDCWNRIGVRGDRSCPELPKVVHCHHCPVFAAAGRRFLDAPSPEGYLEEWTERLIAPIEEEATDLQSVLIFRLGEEWLALRVQVLIEVTNPRTIHRVPHRTGLLAGLVNIRGELHLCVHLDRILGVKPGARSQVSGVRSQESADREGQPRWIVAEHEGYAWVFPVDEVDQVYRLPVRELTGVPATVARAGSRLSRGVFTWRERPIGYLDEERLFQTLRTRIR